MVRYVKVCNNRTATYIMPQVPNQCKWDYIAIVVLKTCITVQKELVLKWKSLEHFLLFANFGSIEVERQWKTKLSKNLYDGGAILVKCFCWYGTKSETVNHFSSEVLQCCIINERRIFSYHTCISTHFLLQTIVLAFELQEKKQFYFLLFAILLFCFVNSGTTQSNFQKFSTKCNHNGTKKSTGETDLTSFCKEDFFSVLAHTFVLKRLY